MDELKARWEQLETPVRFAVIAAAVVIGLIVILKILPALIAAMGIGLLLVLLFVPYWAPAIIAFVRKHPSKGGILALNFFFGWTFVGWVVALAWALSDNTARAGQTVIVNTTVGATTSTVAGTPPPPQHQVGAVVNGHRFDGVSWIPHTPPAPPERPPSPAVGSDQTSA